MDDISYKIKKFRQKSGYTQQQVSNLLNIERSTYSYYEAGKTIPDLKTLSRLAEIFNEPLINLLEDEERSMTLSDSGWDLPDINFSNVLISKESNKKVNIIEEDYHNENQVSKFISDLSNAEQNIVMCFRMLSPEAQQKINEIIDEKIKNESQIN